MEVKKHFILSDNKRKSLLVRIKRVLPKLETSFEYMKEKKYNYKIRKLLWDSSQDLLSCRDVLEGKTINKKKWKVVKR